MWPGPKGVALGPLRLPGYLSAQRQRSRGAERARGRLTMRRHGQLGVPCKRLLGWRLCSLEFLMKPELSTAWLAEVAVWLRTTSRLGLDYGRQPTAGCGQFLLLSLGVRFRGPSLEVQWNQRRTRSWMRTDSTSNSSRDTPTMALEVIWYGARFSGTRTDPRCVPLGLKTFHWPPLFTT